MAGRLINVTPEDIANGKLGLSAQCPIALALDRELGGWNYVGCMIITHYDNPPEDREKGRSAFFTEVYLGLPGKTWTAPTSVSEFVEAFDDREPVKPFSFELESA